MNVRIFWVRAMKCMCAQTRPRFILSSEGVLGDGVWTHVNSKGKIPSTGKCPQRSIEPATLWQWAQALPTELFRPPSDSSTKQDRQVSSANNTCTNYKQPPRWPGGKASFSRAGGPVIATRSSHASDLQSVLYVATLADGWRYRVRAGLVGPLLVCFDFVIDWVTANLIWANLWALPAF